VAFHNVVDSALVNALQLQHRLDGAKRVSMPDNFINAPDVFCRYTEWLDSRYPLFAQAS